MSFLAANPAGFSHLYPRLVERAIASLSTRNDSGELRPFAADMPARIELRLRRTSFAKMPMRTLLWSVSAVMYPAFARSQRRGLTGARRHSVFCFALRAPTGPGTSQNKFRNHGKRRRANFFRAPPRKQTFDLGSRAHSLGSAQCDPSNNGNSKNGDTIMYQNKVTLIGFLGSNPEVRSNDNRSFTTLSLATKSSYKKDEQYVSHTEWHRCVVFGKLSEFAKTLTKGSHIQVEGELRSREYISKKTDSKQRVWEIRVASILKLNRAEKAAPEEQENDQDHDESSPEEVAA